VRAHLSAAYSHKKKISTTEGEDEAIGIAKPRNLTAIKKAKKMEREEGSEGRTEVVSQKGAQREKKKQKAKLPDDSPGNRPKDEKILAKFECFVLEDPFACTPKAIPEECLLQVSKDGLSFRDAMAEEDVDDSTRVGENQHPPTRFGWMRIKSWAIEEPEATERTSKSDVWLLRIRGRGEYAFECDSAEAIDSAVQKARKKAGLPAEPDDQASDIPSNVSSGLSGRADNSNEEQFFREQQARGDSEGLLRDGKPVKRKTSGNDQDDAPQENGDDTEVSVVAWVTNDASQVLPEEVVIIALKDGVEVYAQLDAEDSEDEDVVAAGELLLFWPWQRVSDYCYDPGGGVDDPAADLDLFELTIDPPAMQSDLVSVDDGDPGGDFSFECDDASTIVRAFDRLSGLAGAALDSTNQISESHGMESNGDIGNKTGRGVTNSSKAANPQPSKVPARNMSRNKTSRNKTAIGREEMGSQPSKQGGQNAQSAGFGGGGFGGGGFGGARSRQGIGTGIEKKQPAASGNRMMI